MIAHTSLADHAVLGVFAVAAVSGYAALWSRRRRRRFVEVLAWSSGIAVLLVSTAPLVEEAAATSFTWHMVQHLTIGVVAAPLLVAAHPGRVAADNSPWLRTRLRRLRSTTTLTGYLAAPVVAVALVYLAHVASLYDLALRNRIVHDGQHLAFLLSGVLLWAGALAGRPGRGPARFLTAFAAATALTLLSVWLLTMDASLSNEYVDRIGAADALRDQRLGAGVMWVGMVALTMPLLILAVWRWASAEQHTAERREALIAAAGDRAATGPCRAHQALSAGERGTSLVSGERSDARLLHAGDHGGGDDGVCRGPRLTDFEGGELRGSNPESPERLSGREAMEADW